MCHLVSLAVSEGVFVGVPSTKGSSLQRGHHNKNKLGILERTCVPCYTFFFFAKSDGIHV